MSSWKRGFLEINSDILESILDGPLLKTHIISKSKIDSRTITKYLSTLELVGMIKKPNERLLFEITQKGIDFVHQYQMLVNMIEDDLEKIGVDIKKRRKIKTSF